MPPYQKQNMKTLLFITLLIAALGATIAIGNAKLTGKHELRDLANAKNSGIVAFSKAERIHAATGDPLPGQVYLANESRLTESYYSEPVTEYVTGWAERENIEADLNIIAPAVDVNRRFSYKMAENEEEFLSEVDDIRAAGADFKRVEYKGSEIEAKTKNKGLMVRLDRDNMPAGANAIERTAAKLLARIHRNELRRTTAVLTAIGSNTAKTWDTSAGKDPDMDIIDLCEAVQDKSGLYPNRVFFGPGAGVKRKRALRAQDSGIKETAAFTAQEMADFYGVQDVHTIRQRWQATKTVKSKVLGDVVVAANISDMPDTEDPSAIKRFISPVEGGGRHRVYVIEVGAKFIDVIVECYSLISATASIGAGRLTIS